MDQFVIRESLDYKQGKVDTTRYVALENRIANVAAPYRQAFGSPPLRVCFHARQSTDCH